MTAREGIRETLALLRQRRQQGEERQTTGALELAARVGRQLLLAAVAAGASIWNGLAPFGVAMVAANGSGVCAAAALLGACFGYLCQLEFSMGLRYAAASILTFAVSIAFYDMKWFQHRWVVAMVAAAMTALTGLASVSRPLWTWQEKLYFVAEVLLTAGAAWCYRVVLAAGDDVGRVRSASHRLSLLVTLTTLLLALRSLTIGDWSLGCCLAGTAVLLLGYAGGVTVGAVSGMVLGIGMDMAGTGGALYAVVWGLAGMVVGMLRERNRPTAVLCWSLCSSVALLWTGKASVAQAVIVESVTAAGVVLFLPRQRLERLREWLGPDVSEVEESGRRASAERKLYAASKAFHTLYESLAVAFSPPKNDNDVAMVFDRAAGRVCRDCSLWALCWQKEYGVTFNALNDATPAMVKRGKAQQEDFPTFFSGRCVKWQEFLTTVNEELTALMYRRQYQARIRENRGAVCRQYDQLSVLLEQTAEELSRELSPDLVADRRIRRHMAQIGLSIRTGVFRDHRGLLRLEAEGADCGMLERTARINEISALLGVPMRLEQSGEGFLSLVQQEPLMALAGVAAQKKSGETVSGDAGTYFKCADGTMYVLLCDGMGSGVQANRESSLAVRLLEQFLQAGVHAQRALVTLASALALRGEETGGFTTVDLLAVDLFSGAGTLYKLGAAPTYVRQGEQVRRLSGSSLPAGLAEGSEQAVDQFSLRLKPGDCVLMISDGICGTQDDGWILEKLRQFRSGSPRELARELLLQSPQGATDDRTALAVRIERRV